MITIKHGCTRMVFLIGRYAIKIPQLTYSWQLFLQGLLGNMQEVAFSKVKDDRMCPVVFFIPGGWLLVMPKCRLLTESEYLELDKSIYRPSIHGEDDTKKFDIPVEITSGKRDSFGWYKNKVVAIDFGS